MSKTANSKSDAKRVAVQTEGNAAIRLWLVASARKERYQAEMLDVMRLLKKVNIGDAYLENYLGMIEKYGPKFFDTYHLLRAIGETVMPKRILEIGTRTGISLCQLLSSMEWGALDAVEKIVCVDPFDAWTSANLVRANLKHLDLPYSKPKIMEMKSEDYFAIPEIHDTFDFILVDGDHSKPGAALDLAGAHRLIERGGIIVFDDISTNEGECGLITEWDAFMKQHGQEYFSYARMEGKGVAWGIKK